MRIAIKRNQTEITEDGRVAGFDAGATLVRRFLRLFPGAQVIGPEFSQCDGFDVVPLEFIDPTDTVIINMDVVDSPAMWNQIYSESGGIPPQIMNFVWWPVAHLEHVEQSAAVALSSALFPTFANSERTASEVRELVHKQTIQPIARKLNLGWVNLGFRLDHVKPRVETEVPVVRYPAIYLTPVKRPDLFLEQQVPGLAGVHRRVGEALVERPDRRLVLEQRRLDVLGFDRCVQLLLLLLQR